MHQSDLRVESYQGLMDHIDQRAQAENVNIGILSFCHEGLKAVKETCINTTRMQ